MPKLKYIGPGTIDWLSLVPEPPRPGMVETECGYQDIQNRNAAQAPLARAWEKHQRLLRGRYSTEQEIWDSYQDVLRAERELNALCGVKD